MNWTCMTNVLTMISQIMKEAGINLFPAEDSSKYVSIQNKVRKVQHSCLNKAFVATIHILMYHINYWNFEHAGTQIFF